VRIDRLKKQNEEYKQYEELMRSRKEDAEKDQKIIDAARQADIAQKEAQEETALRMQRHEQGNDEESIKRDEKSIVDFEKEERKFQEEANNARIEEEQKCQQQYDERKELERKALASFGLKNTNQNATKEL